MEHNQLLAEALRLADLGYSILPCAPRDKRPLTEHGLKDATTEAEQIERWWAEYPQANIGLRTNGLLVIDIDEPDSDWPNESRCEDLANAPMSVTPRGGSHIIFKQPHGKSWRNTSKRLAEHIDTRADEGYIVVSPSETATGKYRWVTPLETSPEYLPEPPAWLTESIDALSLPVTPPPKTAPHPTNKTTDDRERLALDSMMRMAVKDKNDGSLRLYAAACRAVEYDLDDDQSAAVVLAYLSLRPSPRSWTKADVVNRVRQAERGIVRGSGLSSNGNGFHPHLVVRQAANIERQELRWLWRGRFALGKVNVLCGPPGDGKSFVCLDMAARVSRGTPWPDLRDEYNPQGRVLVFSGEDDPNDTIRPRLDEAGADTSQVYIVDGMKSESEGPLHLFQLDAHMVALENQLKELRPSLCIIDPISCYLGKIDSHKDADLRRLLAPLSTLAGEYHTCIMLVSHLNKRGDGDAMNRIQGSIALPAAARTAWLLKRDPEDESRRLIMPIKINVAEAAKPIAFRIIDGTVAWSDDAVNTTANTLLSTNLADSREKAEARTWLEQRLSIGPVTVKELEDEIKNDQPFSWVTVKRVKADLKIKASRQGYGKSGGWVWELPSQRVSETSETT